MKLETKLKNWTLSKFKKQAWDSCSIYNRRKDTDKKGYGNCCTCKKRIHWTDGDAGHFQAGRGNAILFYDKGIHLQCKRCNGPGSGEQYLYGKYIEERYGKEEVEKQIRLKRGTRQYTKLELHNLNEEYKERIKNLCH